MLKEAIDSRDVLIALSQKNNGDTYKIISDVKEHKDTGLTFECSQKCITFLDADFPAYLKKSFAPPLVIYYDGDIGLLSQNNILCVAGARELSNSGKADLDILLKGTTMPIVVGLSSLPNSACAKVIELCSKIILVLPFGLDFRGDALANEMIANVLHKGGLVITEIPRDNVPTQETHMAKTRLAGCIAKRLLVSDCKSNSGTMVLVNICVANNKEVLVIPKSISESNDFVNNELIFEGAAPCYSREQLTEESE